MYSVMAVAVVASCAKDPVANEDDKKPGDGNTEQEGTSKPAPELEEVALQATPVGETLTFDLEAEGAWTIAADDCDWVTVEPASGTGNAEVSFTVAQNDTGKDRSVSFFVTEAETETHKEGEIYEVFISQVKLDLPVLQGDYEFLKWLVENNAYGDATPNITDWYSFMGEGFPSINFAVDAAGKFYIDNISIYAANEDVVGNIFNSFPPEVNLSNLTSIYINYSPLEGGMDITACPLIGSEFPQEWNCPKLEKVHLECAGMVGPIPQSFADLPNLRAFFVRSCDFYGALPQKWASTKIESIVLGFNGAQDCPNLGYMVPSQFDIILNSEKTKDGFHNDRNEFKIGGNRENWLGFEEGWGQKRYERFDPEAVAGDKTIWSVYRHISEATTDAEIVAGGVRNPNGEEDYRFIDSWPGYYGNIKDIPTEMLTWDQSEADAYTEAAAKRDRIYTR